MPFLIANIAAALFYALLAAYLAKQVVQQQKLNLPHLYKVEFSADTQSGTFLAEWIATLTQFTFNEKIDPAAFSSN